ncbi:MAG: hypothetical protein ACRDDD_10170 [Plesiomonas sp.]|uniref:hypothetical protein n=1 Tax=Plesiomonas sp. TaxID=2486279 RepID=UPI003EE52222
MIGISRLLSGSNIKNTELSMESLKSEKSELKRSIKELKRLNGQVKPRNSLIHRFLGAKLSPQKINVWVRARFISSVKRTYGSSNEEINNKHNGLILRLSKSNSMALQRKTKLLNDIKSLKHEINKDLTVLASKKMAMMSNQFANDLFPEQRSGLHPDVPIRNISFQFHSPEETIKPITENLLEDIQKALCEIISKSGDDMYGEHIYINERNENISSLRRESGSDSGYESPVEASPYLPMSKFRTPAFDYVEMTSTSQINNEPIYDEIK